MTKTRQARVPYLCGLALRIANASQGPSPCSCPAAPRTLHRASPPQSQRLGKGQSLPNLPNPHRTPLLLLLILFYNPRTTKLSRKKKEKKKSHYHLAQHCHNGLHYDPLKRRINFECSSVNFISLPSVSPWFASPEMEREGEMQTLFSCSCFRACHPGRQWSVTHTMTKPAQPHGNKIITQQAGSTEGFLQPEKQDTLVTGMCRGQACLRVLATFILFYCYFIFLSFRKLLH